MRKILIIGAGAIGGVTAGILSRAGHHVSLVCKYPDLAKKITTEGLEISGYKGDFYQTLSAEAKMDELKEEFFDFVLIATKATDMAGAAKKVLPLLKEDSLVVSMQNGICEDELAAIVGGKRTIGCVVGWGATMHQPGKLEMTSSGEFVIGALGGKQPEMLLELKTILNEVVPVRISENIYGDLYAKLIINSCITTLGAVSGQLLGELLRQRKVRCIFIEIIREAIWVAEAMQLNVEPYGKLDFYKFVKSNGFIADIKRHAIIYIIGLKYKRLKSSSLQSLERGNRTEIDYFNGYITRKAKEYKLVTPVNSALTTMVKEIEQGKRLITPGNFNDLPRFNYS
jgi:2-dehydropantoate 2-reductase